MPSRTVVLLLWFLLLGCGARTGLRVRDAGEAGSDVPGDVSGRDDGVEEPASDCRSEPRRCEDHDLCTTDTCQADGLCAHRPAVCDDGNACTDDRCDPARGCYTTPTDCDDHTVCTSDRCEPARGCQHATIPCDDRDPCTADRCDPVRGCEFPPTDCRGCADGQRDAFLELARYPRIAACAGGFANAGLSRESGPACGRGAGDDGPNPSGRGCSATDLCAPGWHVCRSDADVAGHSPDGCNGARDAAPGTFYATRQTGPGCGYCATGSDPTCGPNDCRAGCAQTGTTTNDIFGCGTLGDTPERSSCHVLDRFGNNLCSALRSPWRCDQDPTGLSECDVVIKPGAEAGGVLCCQD